MSKNVLHSMAMLAGVAALWTFTLSAAFGQQAPPAQQGGGAPGAGGPPGAGAPGAGGGRGAGRGGGRGGRGVRPPAGPFTRLPDGKPNFSGYWMAQNNGGAVFQIDAHETAKPGVPPGRGMVVDPPDGKIPYTPEAAAKAKENFEHHMNQEPELHCMQSGVPHQMNVQFGFEILQPPGYVVMTWEFMHAHRIIPTDNRPHVLPAGTKLIQGDSVGHWEGDTLVVDTTNLSDRTWLDTVGNFHSDAEHVIERFTPVDANTISYEATIEDPKVYMQPWKIKGEFWRNTQPNYEQMEFACIEGNEDVGHYDAAKEKTRSE